MNETAEWEAQATARRQQQEAGGGCIGCPHGFHLHGCPFDGCLCDNQGRTETMQDRRASWEKRRKDDAANREALIVKVRAEIAEVFWDHLSVMPNAVTPGTNFGPVLDNMAIAAVDAMLS